MAVSGAGIKPRLFASCIWTNSKFQLELSQKDQIPWGTEKLPCKYTDADGLGCGSFIAFVIF